MSDRPTPETDAFSVKFKSICGSKAWVPTDICRRLERERDEAREELSQISEYGTEEINAAVELRQKLAAALLERDNASEAFKIAYNDRVSIELERNEARRLACLYRDQFYAVSMPTVKPPKFSWEEGYIQ